MSFSLIEYAQNRKKERAEQEEAPKRKFSLIEYAEARRGKQGDPSASLRMTQTSQVDAGDVRDVLERIKQSRAASAIRVADGDTASEGRAESEEEINRREKNRSARDSQLPDVRAGAVARMEKEGESVRELLRAEDVEKWAEEQVKSEAVRKQAQRIYDTEFAKARMRGDLSPAVAAENAAQAYLDLYRSRAQQVREDTYNYRQNERRSALEKEAASVQGGDPSTAPVGSAQDDTGSAAKRRGIGEEISALISSPEEREKYRSIEERFGESSETLAHVEAMTDTEKSTIQYFASSGQYDKVEEYYKLLKASLNKRIQEAQNKKTYSDAYKNPVKGAAKNVMASFATPAAYAANAANTVANLFRDEYVPTDTNTDAFSGAHAAKETSGGVTQRAYDSAGGGTRGEIASLLAGTGLSMANFLSKAPLGATGAMLAMGADTAGQTTLDVLERGGSGEQALLLSTAAGAIEALTEKMPLDNLFRTAKDVGKTGMKTTIKSVLKQSGMEATEEIVSELANTVLDIAVMRENSGYKQYMAELEASEMSRAEAEKEAIFQYFGKNILMAGAGGAISGAAMGGGASAVSGITAGINRNRAGGGFVKTEYSGKLGNKTIRALDAVGRKLGVKISIGAPTGEADGAHDGYYENGEIVIAQDAKNPLEVVLAHEVAHHLKTTAPEEYNAFLELAVKLGGGDPSTAPVGSAQDDTGERFGSAQDDTGETARDEIAARFTQKLVKDTALFERVAQSDKGAARKLIDGVKEFAAKVKATFGGDAKSDTAAKDKYGAKVEELERAAYLWEKMLSDTETAVASGNKKTAGEGTGGRMYLIKENAEGKYVKAERQVIFGNDPEEWGEQVENFINKQILAGQTVEIPTEDGDTLLLNEQTAGKASFRNFLRNENRYMNDEEYLRKLDAEAHIDELAQISKRGDKVVPDFGGIHGEMAKDGWNYRTAHFEDFDGKYYRLIISTALGENGKTVYNISGIRERSFPTFSGSSATNSGAHRNFVQNEKTIGMKASSEDTIPQVPEKSNRENLLKETDGAGRDPSAKPQDDTVGAEPRGIEGDPSAEPQDDTGKVEREDAEADVSKKEKATEVEEMNAGEQLDTYFGELGERTQVIQDKRIEDANRALMKGPKADKKSGKEKVEESVSFIKRKMVNSADTIRKIAKATNDKYLYPALNRARSSMNIVSDMLRNKQTDIRGKKVGESLEGIIAPMKKKGDEYFRNFQLYLLHKHNVARMSLRDAKAEQQAQMELELFIKENPGIAAMGETALQKAAMWDDEKGYRAKEYIELRKKLNKAQNTKNKPIFFDSDDVPLGADESRREAARLLHENPDFAENEKKIRTYLDNLMQYRVDSGLITQEEADYFKEKYPDYVPTYRDTESARKQMQGKTNIGKTVGRATGGNEPIIPLDVALSEMTKSVVRSGQKNIFANKVFDLFDKNSKLLEKYITDVNEGEHDADAEIEAFGEAPELDNTVTFHKDGKRIELTVTPELFEAFDTLSRVPKEQPEAAQVWRKVNEAYKKLITTYDVTFIVRNGLKDLFDGIFQSRNAGAFLKNYGKAFKEIATGGEMWELYQAAGGLYSSRFEEMQENGISAKSGKLNVKEKLAFGNMMVEQAPRLAEFMSVVEKGDINDADTIADALLAAADVTTNFGESGTWGKMLNAYYIPFLNPAIQGTAKVVRTFTESRTGKEWVGLALKCTLYGLGAGFLNDLLNGDDEDYENLPDRTKDNYFLIRAGDGKFIRLPKGRIMAALGIVTDRVRDVMTGEKVDAGEALLLIAENILPENPLNNNIFKAWFDADLFNDESKGKTWYGTDIENETLQSLPAGERFDNSTDSISKAIGKALGASPKKLNYILQQYTGGIGRTVLPMITPKEQKGDSIAGKVGYGLLGILTSNFTTDSKLSNKISGEFYDAVDAAEQKKNSAKGTLADKVVYKHLNRERNMVAEYSAKVREAEVDKELTSKERQAAVRAASAERTAYQKTIIENLDRYRKKVEKYLKKYPGEDEEKKVEYAYREANREMYGEEYAIRTNGGSAVYKKAAEKVERGKTTWEEYYDEYFGKTERRYEAISEKVSMTFTEFEKIAEAMSGNDTKEEKIEAIKKLGYRRSVAKRIYSLYTDC